jgi:hypothetical protein
VRSCSATFVPLALNLLRLLHGGKTVPNSTAGALASGEIRLRGQAQGLSKAGSLIDSASEFLAIEAHDQDVKPCRAPRKYALKILIPLIKSNFQIPPAQSGIRAAISVFTRDHTNQLSNRQAICDEVEVVQREG